jgi:hypothetical protein
VLEHAVIAADWHDGIYAPPLAAIDRERLSNDVRDAPDADLFLLLHRHRREAFPSCGCPPLEETVETALVGVTQTQQSRLRFRRR